MSDDAGTKTHFDLIVIGGGPGGYGAALYGSAAGLDVAVVEMDKVGGTCLHRGCIPAKELLETAHVFRTVGEAARFGVESSAPTLAFGTTMARKAEVVGTLFKGLSGLLKSRKVTMFSGVGTLQADRSVVVAGLDGERTQITGDAVILASGSAPRTIPGFYVDGTRVLTSDEVFELERLPARVAVIGGGAIGCEFASMLADLGSEVTVLEALPQILPTVDKDVVQTVLRSFKGRGITVQTGVQVTGHTPGSTGTTIHIDGAPDLPVDAVIVSVGRRPLSDTLGLDGTGVLVDERGFVEVDELCRTAVDGVWAIGDLIATPGLAHVGYAEAILVIKQLLGEPAIPVDYAKVAWCIYSRPEVAFVGLSEQAARDAGHDVSVAKHRWGGNSRALIIGDGEGMVKVIAEKRPDGSAGELLGVHMSGPWVTELLGQAYLSVNWEATVDDIAHFVQPHPSLSENFGEAVLALTGRSLNS
ncbi:MAG: dihydrolipoyl dehydrogenase [Actinobacteria bacterium]|nr:dihydrolipoyl dehydrogenase [Actinomycetota bacterium]